MTDREFIISLGAQIDAHLAGTPPDPEDVESPTGRSPRLVWTSALQRTYNRMWSEREAGEDTLGAIWCDVIVDNARGNVYGDYGLWATIAYQMTGDPEFVEIAWRKLEPVLASSFSDGNTNREYSAERVLTLDWLWPGLSEAQRSEYLAAMDRMCAAMVATAIRTNDSDQVTGCYFGMAFYSLAFGDLHPPAAQWLARPDVGGLDATARDRTTLRNAMLDFVAMAEGGEWIESQEYNLGTVRLLLIGAAGVQSATGADHFPEVTAWAPQHALKFPLMTAPDLAASMQWGDEQHPHLFEAWRWVCTAMCVNHPVARAYVYDLVAQYGPVGYNTAEPTNPKAFLLFDPYGPAVHERATLFDARGQGILVARSESPKIAATM